MLVQRKSLGSVDSLSLCSVCPSNLTKGTATEKNRILSLIKTETILKIEKDETRVPKGKCSEVKSKICNA